MEDVEAAIQTQMGDQWDRALFEDNLMGYTMRTDRYRLVVWKEYRNEEAEPLFFELYDHNNDPGETVNIASKRPELVARLLKQFNQGWQGASPRQ